MTKILLYWSKGWNSNSLIEHPDNKTRKKRSKKHKELFSVLSRCCFFRPVCLFFFVPFFFLSRCATDSSPLLPQTHRPSQPLVCLLFLKHVLRNVGLTLWCLLLERCIPLPKIFFSSIPLTMLPVSTPRRLQVRHVQTGWFLRLASLVALSWSAEASTLTSWFTATQAWTLWVSSRTVTLSAKSLFHEMRPPDSSSCTLDLTTRDSNAFVDVLGLCGNLSTVLQQALVIATQLLIHLLIRELRLVFVNSLLDLPDGHLDAQHVRFVKLITSLMVGFLKTFDCFQQCVDDLIIIIWKFSLPPSPRLLRLLLCNKSFVCFSRTENWPQQRQTVRRVLCFCFWESHCVVHWAKLVYSM